MAREGKCGMTVEKYLRSVIVRCPPRQLKHHLWSARPDHSLKPGNRLHTARCAHYHWRPAREFDTTREMFLFWKWGTGLKSNCEPQRGLWF
ncbi:hypothetical protein JOB18_021745 [Solea senegalensis]|uniref:Uncharacterized protein n=1 Tax=Solea senegalensis TaxID=28829 RepID=A0AAV6Q263_SOLSE|nr:hypothetical protein JOB18_021745 [Solea senegalensis]